MLRELNGITTRGLVHPSNTGKDMWRYIWDKYYATQLQSYINKAINANIIDSEWKRVDPLLEKLVGVYQIPEQQAIWSNEFIRDFDHWLYECISGEKRPIVVKPSMIERISPRAYTTHISQFKTRLILQLQNADYNSGYITVGKRTQKILKFIKSELVKYLDNVDDATLEHTDWYRRYTRCKSSNAHMYLVITNSIASHIGMSSYAPMREQNGRRVWSSCQCIAANSHSYAQGLPCNLTDQGSLIAYVTDGNNVCFSGQEKEAHEEFKFLHHQMHARWMIRLLHQDTLGDVVSIDRAYPNDMYAEAVFKVVLQQCKEHNIPLCAFADYNGSQNDVNFKIDRLQRGRRRPALSAHDITFVTLGEDPCDRNCAECTHRTRTMCGTCWWSPGAEACNGCLMNDPSRHFCAMCNNFRDTCWGRDCATCDHCTAYEPEDNDDDDEPMRKAHYNDQGGNSTLNNASNTNMRNHTYKFHYTIYEPVQEIDMETALIPIGAKVRLISRDYSNLNEGAHGTLVIYNSNRDNVFVDFGESFTHGEDCYGMIPTPTGRWLNAEDIEAVEVEEPQPVAVNE